MHNASVKTRCMIKEGWWGKKVVSTGTINSDIPAVFGKDYGFEPLRKTNEMLYEYYKGEEK